MPHEVVLISNDASLASIVQTVIPMPGTLRILRASTELPPEHEFRAETVVLDLPADIRLAARAEVRKRYSGRLLVALSSEDEAEGWPDDPACRFLVRPFQVDEVGAALRARVPAADEATKLSVSRPAESATGAAGPRAISAGPRAINARPRTPAATFTDASAAPKTAAPGGRAGTGAVHARTLPSVPAVTTAAPDPPAAAPEPRPETGRGRGSRRGLLASLLVVVLAAAAALGGVAIGRASVKLENRSASSEATASRVPGAAAPPSTAARSSQAAACSDAMDQADAAIAYLVQGVRDDRLTQAIQRYHDDRETCQGNAGG
jgi:hypothetical protein